MDLASQPALTDDDFDINSALNIILKLYNQNYDSEWEYFNIINDFLYFCKLLIEQRLSSARPQVRSFLINLQVVLNSRTRDVNDFLVLGAFQLYYQEFHKEINDKLHPLNVQMIIEDETIKVVHKGYKRKFPTDGDSIPVKNAFAVLSSKTDDDVDPNLVEMSESNANNSATPNPETKSNKKPYQLFFEVNDNCKNILFQIHSLSAHINAKLTRNQIQVITEDLDSFRTVQKYLADNNIPMRSLNTKEEKPKKFIIRGLPHFTDVNDIFNAFREQKIEPLRIAYLTNRKTKNPMPLFLATLKASPEIDNIKNITKINYLAVTFEVYNQKGASQCYRCQEFGHSSLTCHLTPRCVKCSQAHRASECTATRENFRCANCFGNHTSNYKGCPKHPSNRTKNAKKVGTRTVKNFTPAPAPTTNPWEKRTAEVTPPEQDPKNAIESANEVPVTTPVVTCDPGEKVFKATPPPKTLTTPSVKKGQVPTKTAPPRTPKNPNHGKQASNNVSGIGETFKIITEFMKEFNISDVINLFKEIAIIMKSADEPINKLLLAFEVIANYFSDPNHG